MKTSLKQTDVESIAEIVRATTRSQSAVAGPVVYRRQPIHTVYGGAHLFSSAIVEKFRDQSLRSLKENSPTPAAFARALQLAGDQEFHKNLYNRVVDKLRHEPVEDYRIDFEDGFGRRSKEEEDTHAVRAAGEMAKAMVEGTLPPFIGIRVKPTTVQYVGRASRTLDLFLTNLLAQTGNKIPANFVVTLPKVDSVKHIVALVKILDLLEERFGLPAGILKMELMVETPRMFTDILPFVLDLSRGRCVALHFGPYDFTASLDITTSHQRLDHPACDLSRALLQLSFAGTGVFLVDGPTNIIPVGPYRAEKGKSLTPRQHLSNRQVVHEAWRLSYRNISRALEQGYYQGWDLHPAQLPVRYAATYAFFLTEMEHMAHRLKTLLSTASGTSFRQSVFDDAATGRGMINFFQKGFHCGALTEADFRTLGFNPGDVLQGTLMRTFDGKRPK